MSETDTRSIDMSRLELFADVCWNALAEVGRTDLVFPAFIDDDTGDPYLEWCDDDLDDIDVDMPILLVAERLALEAIRR